jgi:hypothetical protein
MKFSEVKKTTRLLIPLFLTISIFLAAAELSLSEEADYLTQMGVVKANQMSNAPAFVLPDIQGRERRLSDFQGNFVMLNFWATW